MTSLRALTVALALAGSATAASAQTSGTPLATAMPSWASLIRDLPRDLGRLPTRTNALWLGSAGGLAWAVHPEDATLTRRAAGSHALDVTLRAGAALGSGGVQAGFALAMFTAGRLSGHPATASIGADLVRAQIITGALTQGLKRAVNRPRPNGGRLSFPSGHTSATIATVTVLQRRLGWRVGVPGYALAAYIAASRLQDNQHYLSDVIMGAGLGLVSGRSVTHGHGTGFSVAPLALRGGGGIGFTTVWP